MFTRVSSTNCVAHECLDVIREYIHGCGRLRLLFLFVFFFFQAEDGIRDVAVTGVQTCALPIFESFAQPEPELAAAAAIWRDLAPSGDELAREGLRFITALSQEIDVSTKRTRSEERRVGKECRSRWSPYH